MQYVADPMMKTQTLNSKVVLVTRAYLGHGRPKDPAIRFSLLNTSSGNSIGEINFRF